MRVFVTGATGLLGSNIVNAFLTAGHAVKALARTPAKTAGLYVSGDVTVVQGDLGAIGGFAGQLAGCDLLVHAAAYFREYYAPGDHWDRLYRTNVDGTREILSAAADEGSDFWGGVSEVRARWRSPERSRRTSELGS